MSYWLFKTEPSTYSFERLLKDKKTNWNDVRNFQARNHLRAAKVGDQALIYHSNEGKAVVGIARVVREAYPDPDPEMKGDWVQIDLAPVCALARAVTLEEIKASAVLKDIGLIKQSRLSCMPVTKAQFDAIVKMSEVPAKAPAAARRTKRAAK